MSDKRIYINDKRCHCVDCPGTFSVEHVNREGYCKRCWSSKCREVAEHQRMSEQKALFDATRELSRKISNLSKNSAVAPEFFEEFQKELGGARGLGQLIAEDFKRMHGIGLSATEQKLFSPDEKTIQRYWQTLMVFMQQQDRHNAVDISSLSDKELQATLLQLAQELILENPGFRSQVIRIAVAQDRDLINELAMKAGLLGDVVEGDTEPEEPEAIVREDNPAEEPDDFDVDVIEPEEH